MCVSVASTLSDSSFWLTIAYHNADCRFSPLTASKSHRIEVLSYPASCWPRESSSTTLYISRSFVRSSGRCFDISVSYFAKQSRFDVWGWFEALNTFMIILSRCRYADCEEQDQTITVSGYPPSNDFDDNDILNLIKKYDLLVTKATSSS